MALYRQDEDLLRHGLVLHDAIARVPQELACAVRAVVLQRSLLEVRKQSVLRQMVSLVLHVHLLHKAAHRRLRRRLLRKNLPLG